MSAIIDKPFTLAGRTYESRLLAKGHPALKLSRDRLSHKLGIDFRLPNFLNIQEHLIVSECLNFLLDLLNPGTTFPNDNAWTSRMNADLGLVRRTLYLNASDSGVGQPFLDLILELDVLMEPFGIVLLLVPL